MRPQIKETAMKPEDKEHGEGNYKASREYNEATKNFVDSGKVDDAAKAAKPKDQKDATEMRRAEEKAKSHSKGEDGSA
jgi:ribosomal protein L2